MHNVTGIMTALERFVEAHQEPVSETVHLATVQLADAVCGSRAVVILTEYTEQVQPAGPHVDTVEESPRYKLKTGVSWEKVWEELQKA